MGGIFENVILTITQESGEIDPYAKLIEINGRDDIWSIAFLVDGRAVAKKGRFDVAESRMARRWGCQWMRGVLLATSQCHTMESGW